MTLRNRFTPIAPLFFGTLVVVCTVLLVHQIVSVRGLAFDFIDHYNGAQAALNGESPYSDAVTERNQIAWYGSPTDTQDPQRFNYPAYSIFVFGFLTVFPPAAAIVLWSTLQVALCLVMLHFVKRGVLSAVLIFLLLREPLVSVLLAQATLWSAAWIGLGIVSIERKHEVRAGLCFALSTLHPVLTVPLALIVLLRYPRALATFFAAMTAALALSFILFGWWLPDWIDNLLNYSSGVSYMVWIARQLPLLIPVGVLLLIIALRQRSLWSRFTLALCSVVMLLPLTGLYHLVLFLPAVARLKWHWIVVVGLASWGLSFLPFDLRVWQPVALAAILVSYTLHAELGWFRTSKTVV